MFLNQHRCNQQEDSDDNLHQLFLQTVMVLMVVLVMVLVVMFVFMNMLMMVMMTMAVTVTIPLILLPVACCLFTVALKKMMFFHNDTFFPFVSSFRIQGSKFKSQITNHKSQVTNHKS